MAKAEHGTGCGAGIMRGMREQTARSRGRSFSARWLRGSRPLALAVLIALSGASQVEADPSVAHPATAQAIAQAMNGPDASGLGELSLDAPLTGAGGQPSKRIRRSAPYAGDFAGVEEAETMWIATRQDGNTLAGVLGDSSGRQIRLEGEVHGNRAQGDISSPNLQGHFYMLPEPLGLEVVLISHAETGDPSYDGSTRYRFVRVRQGTFSHYLHDPAAEAGQLGTNASQVAASEARPRSGRTSPNTAAGLGPVTEGLAQ